MTENRVKNEYCEYSPGRKKTKSEEMGTNINCIIKR